MNLESDLKKLELIHNQCEEKLKEIDSHLTLIALEMELDGKTCGDLHTKINTKEMSYWFRNNSRFIKNITNSGLGFKDKLDFTFNCYLSIVLDYICCVPEKDELQKYLDYRIISLCLNEKDRKYFINVLSSRLFNKNKCN